MPNVGYETLGATQRGISQGGKGLSVTMPEAAAQGVTITVRTVDEGGTGENFQACIVDDSDGQTVLAYSDIRSDIGAVDLYVFSGGTLATFTPANGTTYRLVLISAATAGAFMYFDDAGLTGWAAGAVPTLGTPPTLNAALGADTLRDYTIYMTYTQAGGGATLTVPSIAQNYRNMGLMQ